MFTFSTSCQHSPSVSIFKFLEHLCWPFIRAFGVNVSLSYLFPFSQNMRQSTVTTKISRNKSEWVHVYLNPGFKKTVYHKIVSFSENLDIQKLEQRFGEIPEFCDVLSKTRCSPKNLKTNRISA